MCILGRGCVHYSCLSSSWNCKHFSHSDCSVPPQFVFLLLIALQNLPESSYNYLDCSRLVGLSHADVTSQEKEKMSKDLMTNRLPTISSAPNTTQHQTLPQMRRLHVCWPVIHALKAITDLIHLHCQCIVLCSPVKLGRWKPRVIVILLPIAALSWQIIFNTLFHQFEKWMLIAGLWIISLTVASKNQVEALNTQNPDAKL